jgi:hypothetical protein
LLPGNLIVEFDVKIARRRRSPDRSIGCHLP